MLCCAAKFLGDKEIWWERSDNPNFYSDLQAMLSEADAVITYNGRKHDLPWINKELLRRNILPPSPYKHVDLLETVKKHFKFESNKLQFVCEQLGLGSKAEHEGFPLWTKCINGDPGAWKRMKKYNIQDVNLLEKLYKKLQPWITTHPNYSLHKESTVCPKCGSCHVHQRGYYTTNTGVFKRFVCKKCGSWSRSRYTTIKKETRANIIVSAT